MTKEQILQTVALRMWDLGVRYLPSPARHHGVFEAPLQFLRMTREEDQPPAEDMSDWDLGVIPANPARRHPTAGLGKTTATCFGHVMDVETLMLLQCTSLKPEKHPLGDPNSGFIRQQ